MRAPFGKGRVTRQQKVKRAAERIDVGPAVDRVAIQRLFGCEVVERAEDRAATFGVEGEPGSLPAQQHDSQVEDFHDPVAVEQKVGRLDVTVDQPGLRRVR